MPVPGRPVAANAEQTGANGLATYSREERFPRPSAAPAPSTQTTASPTGPKEAHMEKLPQNIQEAFLNAARKDRTFLTIYLMSGVKLSGRIRSFDKYSVVLESNNQEQLIFKHAISTVVVAKPSFGPGSGHHAGASPGVPHAATLAAPEPAEP
jgi:host factor-I protein